MFKSNSQRGVATLIIVIVIIIVAAVIYLVVRPESSPEGDKSSPAVADDSKTRGSEKTSLKPTVVRAVLSPAGDQTNVAITLTDALSDGPNPVHIHSGSCDNLGSVKYSLTDVVNGASVTILDLALQDLMADLPLAINVHKSAEELNVYLACADLKDTTKDADAALDDGEKIEKDDGEVIEDDKDTTIDKPTTQTLNLNGLNFDFSETEIRVKMGDTVVINFTSAGGFHDWTVDEFSAKTSRVNTGQSTSVTFVANKKGTFQYYCSVGSHRALGMIGNLIVE